MPKADYQKTQIYKIVCLDLEIKYTYVGHTTNFVKRKTQHKHQSKNANTKVYTNIRLYGGWENWRMILVEDFPCNSKLEAEQRERYWYESLNADLNERSPSDVCVHGKRLYVCTLCSVGKGLCSHNRQITQCLDCEGSSTCFHKKSKSQCLDCHGSNICSHNKTKYACKECYPVECPNCKKIYSKISFNKHTLICSPDSE